MVLGSTMKKSLVAATVAAGVLSAAAPAKAQSLQGGFLPGLMGSFAAAAIAASAQAAQQQNSVLYVVTPGDLDDPAYWDETPPAIAPSRQPARRAARTSPRAPARSRAMAIPVKRVDTGAVERCKASLASNSRALGSVAVNVKGDGPEAKTRGGSMEVPLVARIEYARNGRKQVRQARVTCRLSPEGQVLAFR